jgi:hypothetical protein
MEAVMKQDFSDRATFLKAMTSLREATFYGRDLVHDEAARTLSFTLTRTDQSKGGAGSFMASRKPAFIKTLVTVRHIGSYTQYLSGGADDVYVLDRAEVGRAGKELAFFFRPGDRAVMDVDSIEGFVEDAGRATSAPRKPVIQNPLLKQERDAEPKTSIAGKLLGKPGGKKR